MKYNNLHKLSLHICAGMPVVVWDKSAIADFARQCIALEGENNKRGDA